MVALLLSLSLVTWRQNRAREVMATLDSLQRQWALLEAEEGRLRLQIQTLESRGRVVQDARADLGMVNPGTDRIVLLVPPSPSAEAPR
jgi:cell division protein FtsL